MTTPCVRACCACATIAERRATGFQNTEGTFTYRMSAVQAALGVAQMEQVDVITARKRYIFEAYREKLCAIDCVALNVEPEDVRNGY